MSARTIALRFLDVSACYARGQQDVLRNVSFEIDKGEKVALFGLNGSGKTTVLLATTGIISFNGRIEVGGRVLAADSMRDIRRSIGFLFSVPDDQLLFPVVIEDVAYALVQQGERWPEAKAKAMRSLRDLQVQNLAQKSISELSHGQRQRVALAGALVHDPDLLLFDEPSAGLDPVACASLGRLIRRLPAATLMATHDTGFARQCCDRFLLLEEGRVLLDGVDFDLVDQHWASLNPNLDQ